MLSISKARSTVIRTLGRCSITTSHNAISSGDKPANLRQLRRPARGGQNLSERYKRLEKSLRGKDALSRGFEDLTKSDLSIPTSSEAQPGVKFSGTPVEMFYGFPVPQEPKPPADDECCMSGCAVCVYDLHEESLEAYNSAASSLRTSLSALNIPESEWPLHIQIQGQASNTPQPRKDAIFNAFEEMERALEAKKQGREGEELRP